MKPLVFVALGIVTCLALVSYSVISPEDEKPSGQENFYKNSLHYTNKGLSYIYSKEQGGLERLTGMPAGEMGCQRARCHAYTCDACHVKESGNQKAYTLDTAVLYAACRRCHGDMARDNPDVHFSRGMKCNDCHTSREIHGDGTEHNTYLEPGFFDVSCRKCHVTLTPSESHTVHGDKLDCIACHGIEGTTCMNCHIETRYSGGKDAQIPLHNMAFLVNHNGKVTLANLLTYVYQNKTMITFAKDFSHSVKKAGRVCKDCHGTAIVNGMKDKTFRLTRWEKDSLVNVRGVIPVLDGYDWNLVFLTKENGKWVPLPDPEKPLLNYSGYCSPITQAQFESLLKFY
ncbi:MAG TPA: hypothetical protein VMC08_02685 [Bacteroidales bacterium]|nr:hypothetical protein [Bacteroidales bacterium]